MQNRAGDGMEIQAGMSGARSYHGCESQVDKFIKQKYDLKDANKIVKEHNTAANSVLDNIQLQYKRCKNLIDKPHYRLSNLCLPSFICSLQNIPEHLWEV